MRQALDHLSDANYCHYALQLNIYRFIHQSEFNAHSARSYLS